MPTKRTRISRPLKAKITPAAVESFRIGMATRATYFACIRKTCDKPNPGEFCETCTTFKDADATLDRELGLGPWEPSPLDPYILGPLPDYMRGGDLVRAQSWEKVQELRRALDEALRGS